jgi:hypothetical protein
MRDVNVVQKRTGTILSDGVIKYFLSFLCRFLWPQLQNLIVKLCMFIVNAKLCHYFMMLQKENSAERRESFIHKRTHFSVNNNMPQHRNTLTYDLVQCDISKSEQLPENCQVGPKHVAVDVILVSF